jgi:hypothetical protein
VIRVKRELGEVPWGAVGQIKRVVASRMKAGTRRKQSDATMYSWVDEGLAGAGENIRDLKNRCKYKCGFDG